MKDLADRGCWKARADRAVRVRSHSEHQPLRRARPWFTGLVGLCGGTRFPRGAAFGKTNDKGTEVTEGQCDHGNLFHTYLQAVGVDSNGSFNIDGRDLRLPIRRPR